jgi:hypothetical protein
MKEEPVNGTAAEVPAKKLRRGVSNQTQAVSQLKFHEKDAAQNGLFIGHLEEVRVDWSVNADGKQFTGMKVPRLTLHFTSNHSNVNERRHVYQTLFPVESNVNTIPNGTEEWKVNNVFNWIKHMLDVFYLGGRQLTEAEEDALTLPFVDWTESGEYNLVDPQEVLDGYAVVFNNAADMLNGRFGLAEGATPKPVFKDANGKPFSLWMKLLRHRKRKTEWINVTATGDLGFDGFIGAGAIEIQKPNTPPAILRLDLSRESITPKETKKTPTIGNPAFGPMGFGGVAVPNDAAPMPQNPAFSAAGEEMPF